MYRDQLLFLRTRQSSFFCHSCESRNPQPRKRCISQKQIPVFAGFSVSSVEQNDKLCGRIGSENLIIECIGNYKKCVRTTRTPDKKRKKISLLIRVLSNFYFLYRKL
ncbi:Uncharacterized protein dnm_048240 [Desulfonema magnum]|uniref:Uncharacterized protein n=1 Tax=Desulfonema magnum TaxID=45655 RepID=A0A975BNG5_9BACT|nr:Uncharacterized protein dnm_048240 [Desulfonema magnum]